VIPADICAVPDIGVPPAPRKTFGEEALILGRPRFGVEKEPVKVCESCGRRRIPSVALAAGIGHNDVFVAGLAAVRLRRGAPTSGRP